MSTTRRSFIHSLGAGTAGIALTTSLTTSLIAQETKEEDVAPAEDLMREHGVLNRILLIYGEVQRQLRSSKPDVNPEPLKKSAGIIRHFIEDYHEKLEEDHLFPRFEQAGKLIELVKVLRQQHDAGRKLTDTILHHASAASLKQPHGRKQLIGAIDQFIYMYRPHEAREDTVLFPALHGIVSANEYDALGEDFERKEHELFGKEGFEGVVDQVAGIEKSLGIYELSKFTPKL
ncbi:MAG TPA: hemerythrin domain-containing protein [Bacteroidota bacterium]|nr:hemerythrin domain-containing protein [Bacteroidota bacterium]